MVWKKWTKKRVYKVKPSKAKPKSVLIAQTGEGYAVDVWYPGNVAQHFHYKRVKEAEKKFRQVKRKHPKIRSHAW